MRDLADRLADPHTPLAELTSDDRTVASAFALSYDHLSPASQRMFRLLGLHPGEHFDAYAAAAMADIGLDDAQRLLDEMIDGNLVQETRTSQYRLHDLLKAYAADLADTTDPAPIRSRAILSLLDYYLHGAVGAGAHLEIWATRRRFHPDEPLRPDLATGPSALGTAWLESARPNLTIAVHYAARLGFDRHAWQLARAIWKFLHLHGYIDDLIRTHRCGLVAAERLGDEDAIAMTHNNLAAAYHRIGNHDEAAASLRHTIAHYQRVGDRAGETIACKNLAVVHATGGQSDEGIRQLQHALAIARRSCDVHVNASLVTNLGAIYLATGRYEQALLHSRRGLALAREAADDQVHAIALGNIGAARARRGELGPALRLLTAALAAKHRTKHRYGIGETLNDLGMTYRMLGHLDKAVVQHRNALAIMQEVGGRWGECAVYNEFGRTLGETGDTAAALELHQQALAVATKIQNKYGQARALDGIATCLRETDPESARRHWLRALELYRELDVPERHDVEQHLARLPTPMD